MVPEVCPMAQPHTMRVEDFRPLVTKIVLAHMPDERYLVDAALSEIGREPEDAAEVGYGRGRGELEFGAAGQMVVESIALAWTIYEIIKEARAHFASGEPAGENPRFEPRSATALAEKWERALVKRGVPKKKARAIAAEFGEDLLGVIDRASADV